MVERCVANAKVASSSLAVRTKQEVIMRALEYVHHVIRSGQLKARKCRTPREDVELHSIQNELRRYEEANPEKAQKALHLLINDRIQAQALTH
jgi:hypothetical protein